MYILLNSCHMFVLNRGSLSDFPLLLYWRAILAMISISIKLIKLSIMNPSGYALKSHKLQN